MMDRKRNNSNIIEAVKRLQNDIDDIKLTQPVAGDGWLVYRKKYSFYMEPGNTYKLTYSIDKAISGHIVATLYPIIISNRSEPNTWYFETLGSAGDHEFIMFSTHDGELTMEQL